MKYLKPTLAALFAGLLAVSAGCSDEAQLENAEQDFNEERVETAETVNEANADGIVTEDEGEEIAEERGETTEAAGEVAEQTGDLIESETD